MGAAEAPGGAAAGARARQTCACLEPERPGGGQAPADTVAIVLAGGTGERFGDPRGKQFVELCGLPLMCWSLVAFDRAPSVRELVLVCAPDRVAEVRSSVLSRVALAKPVTFAPAGATRQDSVYSGLHAMPHEGELVAVHDAARPLVETSTIERVCAAVRDDPRLHGAICASRCVDTLKIVRGELVQSTPDRAGYWVAQTPQVFRRRPLVAAYDAAFWDGWQGTDDASLVERHGGRNRVRCVECGHANIKVTLPEDLAVAEATLGQRLVDEGLGRGISGAPGGTGGAGGPGAPAGGARP